ncbi:MAG: iron-containing alcohol dehydrogenase [Alphaproteobacteria bacterium]|nr:iron-containing alcohol dehydrogenase [Alphaproteobacteria bacterium]
MTSIPIEALVDGRWTDPATGQPVMLPFRSIVIAPSLEGREAELVRRIDLGRRVAVVSDPATHEALGQRVERALGGIATVKSVRLPDRPHADEDTVERIRQATKWHDALVAVGSGTINDLCKQASYRDGKPYAVFATAPSMNGYTSTSAAIMAHGHKKSLAAQGARGVFMDLGVLARAPAHLILSGLGDSLCRTTAQVDWLLSHRLRGTAYSETPFLLLAEDEAALFEAAEGLTRGDLAALERLARVLVLCGIGMCIAGTSAPASQAEHLVSHYADMMDQGHARVALGRDALHGEQIGVTTLTVARLQTRLLALDEPPTLRRTAVNEAAIRAHFGASGADCAGEFRAKALDAAETERVNGLLAETWPALRDELKSKLLPPGHLDDVLARAGAPRRPAELGWPDGFYRTAVAWARRIRNRYTCLDLIDDSVGLGAWLE